MSEKKKSIDVRELASKIVKDYKKDKQYQKDLRTIRYNESPIMSRITEGRYNSHKSKKLSYKSGSPIKSKQPNYSFLRSLTRESLEGR